MKRALIAAGIVFLVVLFAGGFLLYRNLKPMFDAMANLPKVPQELKSPKVIIGADSFSKTTYLAASDLGIVTDIEPRENHGLVVVGKSGAAVLTESGSVSRTIRFEACDSDVVVAPIGRGAFLCRADLMGGPSLLDLEGNVLWSYKRDSLGIVADDTAAGELGPTHTKAFVVGMNGDGGIRLLTPEGKEVWRKPDGNVWHVEIAALDEKSGNVIVQSNAAGELTLRDESGNVISRTSPEVYLSDFSLTSWHDNQRNKMIAAKEGTFYILSMNGKTVAQLPAPESKTDTAEAKGTPVHFAEGAPFYAGIVRYKQWARTLLYIYDNQNHIVYDEVIDHECGALQTIVEPNGSESLLLGCDGAVVKYSHLNR